MGDYAVDGTEMTLMDEPSREVPLFGLDGIVLGGQWNDLKCDLTIVNAADKRRPWCPVEEGG